MRWRNLLIGCAIVAAGVLTAFALIERYQTPAGPRVLPVPAGDREIAWFNTTTAGQSWERFVTGMHHAARNTPNLQIDDSLAFQERTTAVPEVVVSWKDRPGRLRIRWYKQTNESNAGQWINALAEREPPPLAIIGGGSSDRARDLARDLNERTQWRGPRPLFFITTATANDVIVEGDRQPRKLTQVYPGRSFRFSFNNEQMARAVIDFVWHTPELRPVGGMPMVKGEAANPVVFPVYWRDDPYSEDLESKFWNAVTQTTQGRCDLRPAIQIDYSVGSFDRANASEASGARTLLEEIDTEKDQRALLILPTSTAPARRFLRSIVSESPTVGRHLVAVNGDAIGFNDVFRDGSMLWNVRDLPVPLVFFAHQNPIGWTDTLKPPAATDEVLLFARMFEVIVQTVLPIDGDLAADADVLFERMRAQRIIPFDGDGNRKDGDEYVVYLRPIISDAGRISPRAPLQVWRRSRGKNWHEVDTTGTLEAPYPMRAADRRAGIDP